MKKILAVNNIPALVDADTGEILQYPFWKTPYNFDYDHEIEQTSTQPDTESKTDTTFTDDSDINTIVKRIGLGLAIIEPLDPNAFGVQNKMTYVEMQAHLAQHRANFYNLPPDVREDFLNDPARWSDQVVKDLAEGNLDNLERLGIDLTELREKRVQPPAALPAGQTPAAGAPAAAPPQGGPPTN